MGPAENRELIQYFADRSVWIIDADAPSVLPERYDVSWAKSR
jgi:hypothetical protein